MRLLLALLALGAMSAPAQAALTLCNRTSYILYAATSAVQGGRSETAGWTRVAPGECQIARKEPLTAQSYLVHARSSMAHSGPARAWGGNQPICVKDGNFTLKQPAAKSSCTDDSFALPFATLDNRGNRVWTMNFDEQPAMTLTEAQLAGVKRLLKDNGYAIAQIDGKPDKATGLALADFRKRMHFDPNAGNAELFQALESEARKKIAPAGYTVCNDSPDALLVALGQMDGGKAGFARLVDGDAGRLRARHDHAAEQRRHLSAGPAQGRRRPGGRQPAFLHRGHGVRDRGQSELRRPRLCGDRLCRNTDARVKRLCRPYRPAAHASGDLMLRQAQHEDLHKSSS